MIGPYALNSIAHGHALELARRLPDNSIDAIITSPPYYGKRDYSTTPVLWPAVTFAPMAGLPPITIPEQEASSGLEADLWAYVGHLVELFRELRRALKGTGSCWINLGDSYASPPKGSIVTKNSTLGGSKTYEAEGTPPGLFDKTKCGLPAKNLMGIPWRVAFALQADGWILRSDIPWLKRNAMPESVKDRPTVAKEYWFLLSKSANYFFDLEAIKMPTAESSRPRLAQDIERQRGSDRANGGAKNNGPMKAVGDPDLRARRDSGWFFDSLRAILEDNAQILLTSEEGDPLALTVNPAGYKGGHFAVFPPALVTPLVLASTSERGCCPAPGCGKPWVRVVEKVKGDNASYNGSSFHKGKTKEAREHLAIVSEQERTAASVTTGWQPTCAHGDLEPVPAVILDPFSGSGTVPREAARNRRYYLGFELNEDYLELAEDRATVQVEMF